MLIKKTTIELDDNSQIYIKISKWINFSKFKVWDWRSLDWFEETFALPISIMIWAN